MSHWQLFFDGACAPINPGGMGCWAYILINEGEAEPLKSDRGVLPAAPWVTNNVAEYWALGCGMRAAERLSEVAGRPKSLTIIGDSKLVIEQVSGRWQCRSPHLSQLCDRIKARLFSIGIADKDFVWVPREKNAQADALTELAYLEATGESMPDMRDQGRKKVALG